MSSHVMPGVDPTLPRSTPVAPIPLPAGTPEGSCFFPTRAAFHRSHTSTSRCVPTMADQASKNPSSEYGRESALDPAPPASKRRRIGLACNACRVRKSRYAMPSAKGRRTSPARALTDLMFVADAMDSGRRARPACRSGSIANTNPAYRRPMSLSARAMCLIWNSA